MLAKIYQLLKFYRRNEKGALAVEFALIAIPSMLLIFGVIEAGRIIWTMNTVQFVIEETSRYASINSDLSTEEYAIYAEEKIDSLAISSTPLQVSSSSYTEYGISFVEIQGGYTITPIISNLFPDGLGVIDFRAVASEPVVD
ncbi:MAG: pilus assembly protein [Alphaproteobacteria bacterium]|nr:pilus assembly protein [Alphaproteobacteria bacterium]